MANFLVWTINNNAIWDGMTLLFLSILARPLWMVSNNNRNALFIVTSKAYGEFLTVFLIFLSENVTQFEFAFPIVFKYCHTLVYLHTFLLALNRAHLVLAPLHYFERVNKIFVLRICAFGQILPILLCYPSARFPLVWKHFVDAGLWISFTIYAAIIAKMLWEKWNGNFKESIEKDHYKIFACCLCTLLPLMCSHYTSASLMALFSDPLDDGGEQITANQVFSFLLNISNNCSTIGDEICLLILCKELRLRVADQFRWMFKWWNKSSGNSNANILHVASNFSSQHQQPNRPMASVGRV